uniref:DUF6570 domain-containing protein n=1 Tax=Plectus sambesii TaxID=2011161 RepID=A0A914WTV5_9BILA
MICADCKKVAVPSQGKMPTMPPMAAANGMGVDEVPLQLQELNWVETMLIQLAKPFQLSTYRFRFKGRLTIERSLNTILSNCRGTAQYWSKQTRHLTTMDANAGPMAFFVTLSAKEYKWKDV